MELLVTDSGNALLLATVSTVGLPVEVQVKDGSLYSGVFHTASVDEGYGIVLKKAMMIEKGKCNSALEVGALVDTLVVLSNDLVQVIVKDFLLPMEGDICYSVGDSLCEGIDTIDSSNTDAISRNEEKKSIGFSGDADIDNAHNVKSLVKPLDNNYHDLVRKDGGVCKEEDEEQSHRPVVCVTERQVGADEAHSPENSGSNVEMDSSTNTVACEDHYSSSCFHRPQHKIPNIESHDDLAFKQSISEDKICSSCPENTADILAETPSNGQISNISTSSSSLSSDNNSSCPNTSASPNLPASEGSSLHSACTKEFTLNPEAKLFFPSFVSSRSASAVIPNTMNTSYMSGIPPAMPVATAAQSSFEISSFPSYTPLPAKFVHYNPFVSGETGINTQYPRPISGPVNTRHQQARFFGQYHPAVQTGTTYVHPHAQPVMVGRAGQLIYMHPISQDPVQGTAILPQGFPVLTPYQANIPKFEGAPSQTMQFCMNPPYLIAAAPVQTYAVPSPVQFSSPIPAIRPITVPSGKDFFGSKFQ